MASKLLCLAALLSVSLSSALVPRTVRVRNKQFVLSATNETVLLVGPNVVVKGPPYLPSVGGNTSCNDVVDANCTATGTCISCNTFNQHDVDHIKRMGWNAIRLGVVWAGAQPSDTNSLDAGFLERLHSVLTLCDRNGIHVMLDNHGDMVGSAGCGNGVPMWVQQKAAPELIGKPLETGFPYNLVPSLQIKKLAGYGHCGANATKWAEHAGDPNYNILNECCQQMNSPNPGALGYTTISQKTMGYVMSEGPGRDAFVRFWKLIAEAVTEHPSAYALELMNEPMSIHRRDMYETWRAIAETVIGVIPDVSVALSDVGEGAIIPAWVQKLAGAGVLIKRDTVDWIQKSNNLFYAWHYYGNPKTAEQAVVNVQEVSESWNVPTFLTEFGGCQAWIAARAANISHTYWHYSSYCTTGPAFGNRQAPQDTFGACILGWAGGDSAKTC